MVKVRIINIYKDTHLPEDGWLQGCYICSSVTGRTIDHKLPEIWSHTKIKVYMCPSCQRLRRESDELAEEFNKLINSYVYSNFTYRPVDP